MLRRLCRTSVEDGCKDGKRRRLLLCQLGNRKEPQEASNSRVEDLRDNARNRPREESQVHSRQSNESQLRVRAHLMILHIFLATQRQVDACGIFVLGRGVGGSVGEPVPGDTGCREHSTSHSLSQGRREASFAELRGVLDEELAHFQGGLQLSGGVDRGASSHSGYARYRELCGRYLGLGTACIGEQSAHGAGVSHSEVGRAESDRLGDYGISGYASVDLYGSSVLVHV